MASVSEQRLGRVDAALLTSRARYLKTLRFRPCRSLNQHRLVLEVPGAILQRRPASAQARGQRMHQASIEVASQLWRLTAF